MVSGVTAVLCVLFFLHAVHSESEPDKKPLDVVQLLIMRQDGVPYEVRRALMLDAIPGANGNDLGDLLSFYQDGQLSKDAFIAQLAGDGFNLPSQLLFYLREADDVHDAMLLELSELYGIPAVFIDMLMNDDTDNDDGSIFRKYYVSNLAGDDITPIQKAVLEAAYNGEDITKDSLVTSLTAQLLGKHDIYTQLAYNAIQDGNNKDGIAYLFIGQQQGKRGFYEKYPDNEALFAYFVEQTTEYNTISASTILNMALGQQIDALNPDATFMETFGVQAYDFVCAAHHDDILVECTATANKFLATPLECVNSGCCYRTEGCYENVLGKIGLGLASDVIDEDHVTTLLGGDLPELANFWPDGVIPWIPSKAVPSAAALAAALTGEEQSFLDAYKATGNQLTDPISIFLGINPTRMPNIAANERRPDFVWKPHGATAFPQATEIPQGIAIVDGEYVFGGPPAVAASDSADPLIAGVLPEVTPDIETCQTTPAVDRYACISNYEALLPTGEDTCTSLGCCYAPDYKDPSIIACFKDISYGQCYNVPNEEKEECGFPGITEGECTSNPRCCWDSTTTNNDYNTHPWCYYKKHSFILKSEFCSRGSYSEPCFLEEYDEFNKHISEASCLAAGCCYKARPRLSHFMRLFVGEISTTVCYKAASHTFTELDAAPADPAAGADADPVCNYDMNPYDREDCGPSSHYDCVTNKGCCYAPAIWYFGAPWCFRPS